MKLINLGCGKTYHPDWINVDVVPIANEVIAHDLRQRLPYPDQFFDACYSSHVCEHLTVREADDFLGECWRILKPGGILRIVVPNLEEVIKIYLNLLTELKSGNEAVEDDYDWIMLELCDQMVRTSPGGEMGQFLSNPKLSNKDFIVSRIGLEASSYWESNAHPKPLWQKIQDKSLNWWLNKIRLILSQILVKIVGGYQLEKAFQEAVLRNSGVVHRWMYDSFSLGRALKNAGFIDVRVCSAEESRIPYFSNYQLDMIEGKIRKPDSLFMEGIKP